MDKHKEIWKQQIAQKVITAISSLQHASAPKVHFHLKEILQLLNEHPDDKTEQKVVVQGLIKKEVRTLFATKHQRDREIIFNTLCDKIMPAV